MHHFITYICIVYVGLCLVSLVAVQRSLGKTGCMGFIGVSAFILCCFLYFWDNNFGSGVWSLPQQFSFGVLLSWMLFTTVISLFVVVETLGRIIAMPLMGHLPSRRKFISNLALAVAAVPLGNMLYGMVKGRYNFQIRKYTLYFSDLPEAFDGYQISHISDIHSGSFDSREKVKYGIDLLNAQKSDAVFFTGDLVNNKALEMENWRSTFAKIKAPDGVFSVLGNHDYGDYVRWNNSKDKIANFRRIKEIHQEIGFRLLLNESLYLKRGGEKIAIIGVENWGKGFIQKGNLSQALANTQSNDFKILLSHDPTHWQYQVIPQNAPIQLTLSGHTHGMQFGIEIPNILRWSPASFRYKYWGGIYNENGKYLNVNTGFGYLAFPGRVGMPPEISIITLKRA